MKLLHFKLDEDRYYLDDQEISKNKVIEQLNSTQFKILHEKGFINIRQQSNNRNNKLLDKYKSLYKIEYDKKGRIELWRKNVRYGYFNCVCYLDNDSEETLNAAIIKDQEFISNKKEQKSSVFIKDDNDLI